MNQSEQKAIQPNLSALHPSTEPYFNHYQNYPDDEIDLKELIVTLWQGKVTILLSALFFAIIAITYALLAQQWWTSKAKITISRPQEVLAYTQQAGQYQSIFDFGTNKKSLLVETEESLFKEFIRVYNSVNSKRKFLDNSSEFQQIKADISADKELSSDETQKLYDTWFKKINAAIDDPKSNDPSMILSFQATTKESSYKLLKQYIEVTKETVVRDTMDGLQNAVDTKTKELEHKKELLETQTKATLAIEIERTQYALAMAKAAKLEGPLEIVSEDNSMFPIGLGAKALEVKLKTLKSLKTMELLEPEFSSLNAQQAMLKKAHLDHDIKFEPFRYLGDIEYPVNRDAPKRALIVILGTLLGGMFGVGIVLIRFAFFKQNEQ